MSVGIDPSFTCLEGIGGGCRSCCGGEAVIMDLISSSWDPCIRQDTFRNPVAVHRGILTRSKFSRAPGAPHAVNDLLHFARGLRQASLSWYYRLCESAGFLLTLFFRDRSSANFAAETHSGTPMCPLLSGMAEQESISLPRTFKRLIWFRRTAKGSKSYSRCAGSVHTPAAHNMLLYEDHTLPSLRWYASRFRVGVIVAAVSFAGILCRSIFSQRVSWLTAIVAVGKVLRVRLYYLNVPRTQP